MFFAHKIFNRKHQIQFILCCSNVDVFEIWNLKSVNWIGEIPKRFSDYSIVEINLENIKLFVYTYFLQTKNEFNWNSAYFEINERILGMIELYFFI